MAHGETMLMNAIYLQYLFGKFFVAKQSHPNEWFSRRFAQMQEWDVVQQKRGE